MEYPKCDQCGRDINCAYIDDRLLCGRCRRKFCTALYVSETRPKGELKKGKATRMEKKYSAPYTPTQIEHAKVGMIFIDAGVKMQITRVGTVVYRDPDGKLSFDSWATPVQAAEARA